MVFSNIDPRQVYSSFYRYNFCSYYIICYDFICPLVFKLYTVNLYFVHLLIFSSDRVLWISVDKFKSFVTLALDKMYSTVDNTIINKTDVVDDTTRTLEQNRCIQLTLSDMDGILSADDVMKFHSSKDNSQSPDTINLILATKILYSNNSNNHIISDHDVSVISSPMIDTSRSRTSNLNHKRLSKAERKANKKLKNVKCATNVIDLKRSRHLLSIAESVYDGTGGVWDSNRLGDAERSEVLCTALILMIPCNSFITISAIDRLECLRSTLSFYSFIQQSI